METTEILTYSTTMIRSSKGSGTGFFMLFNYNKMAKMGTPVLITNKHVIENTKVVSIRLCTVIDDKIEDTKQYEISIPESEWILHPEENVDLCCVNMTPFIKAINNQNIHLFIDYIPKDWIPDAKTINTFSALEEILMIGYPDGVWDQYNNKPVFRRGITATHPRKDFNGEKEFLIDCPSYNGSSGSPVLIYDRTHSQVSNNTLQLNIERKYLLGVVTQTHLHTIDQIGFGLDGKPSLIKVPNDIGYVIKAERILELEQCLNAAYVK